jgi:hypothetical protein
MWIYGRILDLASLSDYEFVSIVAHSNDLQNGPGTKVSGATKNRGYSPEVLAHATKKFEENFRPVVSCNLRFTKPFDHLKYPPMNYVLTLFENYERGLLPFPGSVTEQPAQIMEVFSVLASIKREVEIKASEKSELNGRNNSKNKPRASR